mgnify:CR=1 FL=1
MIVNYRANYYELKPVKVESEFEAHIVLEEENQSYLLWSFIKILLFIVLLLIVLVAFLVKELVF